MNIEGDFWADGAFIEDFCNWQRIPEMERFIRCPVDPVARESTLEFVAGSHLGPWFMPRTFLDGQAKWFPDGSLAELPHIDGKPEFRIVGWELEPGDAVFFHMLTLQLADGSPLDHPLFPVLWDADT